MLKLSWRFGYPRIFFFSPPFLLFTSILILGFPPIVWDWFPCHDMSLRYAPMIRSFTVGDWSNAFHPRVQPFLIISAGSLSWLLKLDPYVAAKWISLLLLAGGSVLVYWMIYLCVKDDCPFVYSMAIIGSIGFAVHPIALRTTWMGLREIPMVFFFILGVIAIILTWLKVGQDRLRYTLLIISSIGLILSRGEAVVWIGLILLAVYCQEVLLLGWRRIYRLLGVTVLILIIVFPWIWYCFQQTGYFITDPKQIVIWQKIEKIVGYPLHKEGKLPSNTLFYQTGSVNPTNYPQEDAFLMSLAIIGEGNFVILQGSDLLIKYVQDFFSGVKLHYLLLFGIGLYLARSTLFFSSRCYYLLLWISGCYVGSIILMMAILHAGFISSRYLLGLIPLMMPFVGLALCRVWYYFQQVPRWLRYGIVILLVLIHYGNGLSRIWRHWIREGKEICYLIEFVRHLGPVLKQAPWAKSSNRTWSYYEPIHKPVILSNEPTVACYGDVIVLDPIRLNPELTREELQDHFSPVCLIIFRNREWETYKEWMEKWLDESVQANRYWIQNTNILFIPLNHEVDWISVQPLLNKRE